MPTDDDRPRPGQMSSSRMIPRLSAASQIFGDRAFDYLFKWAIFVGVVCVGAVVLWDYGYLGYLFAADRSGISIVIVILFVIMSLHCLNLLFELSPELRAVERAMVQLSSGKRLVDQAGELRLGDFAVSPRTAVAGHLRDIAALQDMGRSPNREILSQGLAAKLRFRSRIGIFMSDVLYKLGLLGTVVGFILMLSTMGDLGDFEAETMRAALQAMTGGMATSLLTTITGLVCGTLLRMEYTFVEGLISTILQRTIRLTEVYVVPALSEAPGDV